MALAPYSPLVSGHLTRPTRNSDSVRSRSDGTMRQKYDAARGDDMLIVQRVAEVAKRHELVGLLARPGEKSLAGTMVLPVAK